MTGPSTAAVPNYDSNLIQVSIAEMSECSRVQVALVPSLLMSRGETIACCEQFKGVHWIPTMTRRMKRNSISDVH